MGKKKTDKKYCCPNCKQSKLRWDKRDCGIGQNELKEPLKELRPAIIHRKSDNHTLRRQLRDNRPPRPVQLHAEGQIRAGFCM
jgi:hypothetical protein